MEKNVGCKGYPTTRTGYMQRHQNVLVQECVKFKPEIPVCNLTVLGLVSGLGYCVCLLAECSE